MPILYEDELNRGDSWDGEGAGVQHSEEQREAALRGLRHDESQSDSDDYCALRLQSRYSPGPEQGLAPQRLAASLGIVSAAL